jgi:ABC-type sugar transport system ATPase subunit
MGPAVCARTAPGLAQPPEAHSAMASAAVRNVTATSAESSPPAAIHLRPSAPREHDLGRALLSGGEKQTFKTARAVTFRNRVIIMDEPTNHLSVRERAHVNELAVQLKQQGLLVIYITHDIFQIHRIADRIVIMENGRKVTDVPRDAMSAEALEGIIRDGGRAPAKGPKVE